MQRRRRKPTTQIKARALAKPGRTRHPIRRKRLAKERIQTRRRQTSQPRKNRPPRTTRPTRSRQSPASKGSEKEKSKESTKEKGNDDSNEKSAALRLRRSWFSLPAVPAKWRYCKMTGKDAKSKEQKTKPTKRPQPNRKTRKPRKARAMRRRSRIRGRLEAKTRCPAKDRRAPQEPPRLRRNRPTIIRQSTSRLPRQRRRYPHKYFSSRPRPSNLRPKAASLPAEHDDGDVQGGARYRA